VAHDTVLQRCVQQVVGVEVEAPPLDGGLRGALQQLARGVTEELRDIDALNLSLLRRRRYAAAGWAVAEEVGEEVVEEAPASEAAGHPLLGEIELAEVLGLLRPVRPQPDSRRHRGPSVPLTTRLLGHF
jgi:hypothetical protein